MLAESKRPALGEQTHLKMLVAHCHGPAWARCSEPERPGDDHVVYVWDCRWCMLGLIMDVCQDPLAGANVRHNGEVLERSYMVDTLSKAMTWRAQAGLTMDEPDIWPQEEELEWES